jgi:hypothetical protein
VPHRGARAHSGALTGRAAWMGRDALGGLKWPGAQGCFKFCFIFFSEAYLNDILMKFV